MSLLGGCNIDRHSSLHVARMLRGKARDGLPLRVYVMPSGEVRTRRRDDASLEAYIVGSYTAKSSLSRIYADMDTIQRGREVRLR